MEYNTVKIIRKYSTGDIRSPDYELSIDGTEYLYERFPKITRLYKKWIPMSFQDAYYLRTALLMDEYNPKETLDRFFKLLMLA